MTDKPLTDEEVELLIRYAESLPPSPPDGRWDTFWVVARRLSEVFKREVSSPVEVWVDGCGACAEDEFFHSLPMDLTCTTAKFAHVEGQAAVMVCPTIREHLSGLQEGVEADAVGAFVAGLFLEAAREGWSCMHPCAFGRDVRQEAAGMLASRGSPEEVAIVCFDVRLPSGRSGVIKLVAPWEALEGLREAGLAKKAG